MKEIHEIQSHNAGLLDVLFNNSSLFVVFCSKRFVSCGVWDACNLKWNERHAFNFSINTILGLAGCEKIIKHFQSYIKDAFARYFDGIYSNRAIVSIDPRSPNIFHFLTENLPDIIRLRECAIACWGADKFEILIGRESAFMRSYFDLCGINEHVRCIDSQGHAVEMLISSKQHFAYTGAALLTENLNSVRESLASVYACIDEDSLAAQKIFIERRSGSPDYSMAKMRHIYPIDALHDWMISNNFLVVYLEDLDVIEQIKLFRSSSIVCAMHGAGLTNMIHCRPGTKVVEVTHINSQNNIFRDLAVACTGLEFGQMKLEGYLSSDEELHIVENTIYGWWNLPLKFRPTAFRNALLDIR